MNDLERFWSKVNKMPGNGCWEWQAGRYPTGYGQFYYQGHKIGAHKFAYLTEVGPVPDGMYVCHKCDNPCCVRPDHLFLGTNSDNQFDAVSKGRHGLQNHPESRSYGKRNGTHTHPETRATGDRHSSKTHPEIVKKGEAHHNVKLTEDDVRQIRQLREDGIGPTKLAKQFNVSLSTIQWIVFRRSWRHIP